jgi:NAD(P)-dependent dehydrogenase (short-subunit alcohol dehydrogenase family)
MSAKKTKNCLLSDTPFYKRAIRSRGENMADQGLVIAQSGLKEGVLTGQVAVVTGAGGGIGYQAARSLLWLGAAVVIAEINPQTGAQAAARLGEEFGPQCVVFIPTDVGDEASVHELANQALSCFGKVDIVINNATIAVLGAVKDLPIEKWDASYRVNLRGPVLMAQVFLPGMVSRKHGVFVCVSSTGTSFLGGYETFKAAQVHLANTLDAELEGTGVIAFTIGPGLVPTETANKAVDKLAPLMGMTAEEFFELNKSAVLTVEEAGAGFAASVALAEQFRGQEISSLQALRTAGGDLVVPGEAAPSVRLEAEKLQDALLLCRAVRATLIEQSEGWKERSLFERQWVLRDFKKTAGMPVEEWLAALARLEVSLQSGSPSTLPPLSKLAAYYNHLAELAKGYEKDPAKLQESLRHVYGWKDDVDCLERMVEG